MADLHPPKIETFAVPERVNIDPKGFTRPVAEYRIEPFGLYMARPVPNHPRYHYIESWILPDFRLRITDWWRKPGFELPYDFYLDVIEAEITATKWRTTDLYIDITLWNGHGLEVLDTDELLVAAGAGLVSENQAMQALATCYATIEKLATHDYDLRHWLAGHGISLDWRRR